MVRDQAQMMFHRSKSPFTATCDHVVSLFAILILLISCACASHAEIRCGVDSDYVCEWKLVSDSSGRPAFEHRTASIVSVRGYYYLAYEINEEIGLTVLEADDYNGEGTFIHVVRSNCNSITTCDTLIRVPVPYEEESFLTFYPYYVFPIGLDKYAIRWYSSSRSNTRFRREWRTDTIQFVRPNNSTPAVVFTTGLLNEDSTVVSLPNGELVEYTHQNLKYRGHSGIEVVGRFNWYDSSMASYMPSRNKERMVEGWHYRHLNTGRTLLLASLPDTLHRLTANFRIKDPLSYNSGRHLECESVRRLADGSVEYIIDDLGVIGSHTSKTCMYVVVDTTGVVKQYLNFTRPSNVFRRMR